MVSSFDHPGESPLPTVSESDGCEVGVDDEVTRPRELKGGKEKEDQLDRDLEELEKLQRVLDQMGECPRSPSTSCASSSRDSETRALCLSARRLIRIPVYSHQPIPLTLQGGAALARLITVDVIRNPDLVGILSPGDVLLTVEDVAVSGMLRSTAQEILEKAFRKKDQVAIEVLPKDTVPDDLRILLADRAFSEIQVAIRDNVYSKTVPFTTRPPREGEVDGEHYRFVTMEEFNRLKDSDQLLEHGSYQDHLYGTPRPIEMVSAPSKGPLPPNWEVAYDENGDKYYIDHNNGSTQWDDPRELPDGWEQVDDPVYGTFYVDHVNKRTTYDRPGTSTVPPPANGRPLSYPNGHSNLQDASPVRLSRRDVSTVGRARNPHFTTDPAELRGEMIRTRMVKRAKGLGFTLIGNDSSSKGDEFIQVKSIISGGTASANGVLRPGDVLVRVNSECLLGASQADACRIFVAIPIGETVDIEVCRGYPLLLDPSNRIITENVYDTRQKDYLEIEITKGKDGFGFTICDNATGQRVKKVLFPAQCPNLLEGDVICELDNRDVRGVPHTQLVDMLRELPIGYRGRLTIKRNSPKQRSRTPTAAFRYGGERATPAPSVAPRSKTPAPPTREYGTMRGGRQSEIPPGESADPRLRPSSTTLGFSNTPNYMPLSAFQRDSQSANLITVNLIRKPQGFGFRLLGGNETGTQLTVGQIVHGGAAADDGRLREGDEIMDIDGVRVTGASHSEAVSLLEKAAHNKHVKLLIRRVNADGGARSSVSLPSAAHSVHSDRLSQPPPSIGHQEYDVILQRTDSEGFGFVIISGVNRNGSTIGQIIDGSPAEKCGRLTIGNRVTHVNSIDITNMSHGEIVGLIKASGLSVRLTISPDPLSSLSSLPPSSTLGRASTHAPTYSHPAPTYGGFASNQSTPFAPPSQMSNYSQIYGSQRPSGYGNYDHYGTIQNEITPDQEELISIELQRGAKGFGFSIRGGQEFGAMPLFVLRIADDGPAAADGRLRVGDELIEINGTSTRGLTHEQAIQIIKQHPTVHLQIGRRRLP